MIRIHDVIGTMLIRQQSHASPAVISMLAQGSAPALSSGSTSDQERQTLLVMKALIDGKLAQLSQDPSSTPSIANNTPPASGASPPTALKTEANEEDTEMLI